MRPIDVFGAITVAACLNGCATVSLHLTASAKVEAPLDRVFVVVGQGPFDRSYADEVAGALQTALGGHARACRGRVLTGLELDDAPVNEQMRAFGADSLLMLEPIGGQLNPLNGVVVKVVYRATLLDVRSDRVVWAAEVSHKRGVFVAKRGQLVSEQVVGSLVRQGIVRPEQPYKGGS
ncbi:MAG TPA: hypothetical protein VHO06_23210 [Polyangia bacterium]|nr:hypothetical protein [Polyangia bacterium]